MIIAQQLEPYIRSITALMERISPKLQVRPGNRPSLAVPRPPWGNTVFFITRVGRHSLVYHYGKATLSCLSPEWDDTLMFITMVRLHCPVYHQSGTTLFFITVVRQHSLIYHYDKETLSSLKNKVRQYSLIWLSFFNLLELLPFCPTSELAFWLFPHQCWSTPGLYAWLAPLSLKTLLAIPFLVSSILLNPHLSIPHISHLW